MRKEKNMGRKKSTKKKTKRIPIDDNEIEKTKKYKIKTKKHPKLRKAIKITFLIILLLIIITAGIVTGKLYGIAKEAKLEMAEVVIPYANSEVKDIDGNTIAVLSGEENRESITISEMSEYIPKAFVAIEDERFYEHEGFDVKRTTSATIKYVLSKVGIGTSDYGGSTITQQLIKNLTNEDEKTWQRKVKEIARAYYLEQELSKSQILELYLNLIFLGDQAYGVEVAANYYFSKSASELTLVESAFLAGINNGPNYYEPFSTEQEDIDKITNRTKVVLDKMYELGQENPEHQAAITEEEYQAAIEELNEGITFNKGTIIQTIYSYHTDAAITQVKKDLKEKYPDWTDEYVDMYVKSGGLTIYTTQDTDLQEAMEEEVEKDKYVVTAKDEEGNTVTAQTAMVLIDHTTGYVVATVGAVGEKTTAFGLNRATQSYRQPGSTMKLLAVVCPGIDNGIITAGTSYDDIPYSSGQYSTFKNYGYSYQGLRTVRYHIAQSKNIPMLKAINDIGIDRSAEFLASVGIELTEEQKNMTMALGSAEVSPLQLAAAYAAIANDGVYIEPTFYTEVVDSDGNVVLQADQKTETVMSSATAYIVKEILTEVVKSGAGSYAAISGISVGVKTGTSNDDYDRWFCGITPYYTAATWFGYDDPQYVSYSNGNPSGKIWDAVMEFAHEGLEDAKFSDTRPSNVTTATICKCSGLLATEYCKNDQRGSQAYTEYFIKGTVPTEYCSCHVSVEICSESGFLATEYCPEVETEIYITRASTETGNWAKASDAKYMLITETCSIHSEPVEVEEPEPPVEIEDPDEPTETENPDNSDTSDENEVGNNNVSGGNTTDENVLGENETVENLIVNNATNNSIIGD